MWILRLQMMIAGTPQNVHKICFWVMWMILCALNIDLIVFEPPNVKLIFYEPQPRWSCFTF